MEKIKVSIEKMLSAKETLGTLEELVKGFKSGKLTLADAEQSVTMDVPEMLEMELEAKQKKDKCKITLELSWRVAVAETQEPAVEQKPAPCDKAPCNTATPSPQAAKPTDAPKAPAKPAEPAKGQMKK